MTPSAASAARFIHAERQVCSFAEQLLAALVAHGYPDAVEPEVAELRNAIAEHRAARAEFQQALADAVREVWA